MENLKKIKHVIISWAHGKKFGMSRSWLTLRNGSLINRVGMGMVLVVLILEMSWSVWRKEGEPYWRRRKFHGVSRVEPFGLVMGMRTQFFSRHIPRVGNMQTLSGICKMSRGFVLIHFKVWRH